MINILIVEDEPLAVERLKEMLDHVAPGNNVVGATTSVGETLQFFQNNPAPDLILMDISLADGSCFSIFEVCDVMAPVIFCTAYDKYALDAFQTNGIAYLLKPVTETDLRNALGKLDQLRETLNRSGKGVQQSFRKIGLGESEFKSRFLIKAGDKLLPVPTSQLACFIAEEHGLKVYMLNGSSYYLDYTLAELEEILDPSQFFRISRQAIVACEAVISVTSNIRGAVVSIDAVSGSIPVARDRAKNFREWLGQ
ncbi:MAG: DNA-binding response regulator [Hyphococcus sp.]|nr:MAG: DNA-binding response regulator [Marinicaulis sp.]